MKAEPQEYNYMCGNRSKPGACRHLSFVTNPVSSYFMRNINFLYNFTFQCQIILREAIF